MSKRQRFRTWFLGLLIFGGLVAAILSFAQLEHFARLASQAQPAWLIAGVALQLSTYLLVAGSWDVVLRAAGTPRPLRLLLPLSISKFFADQALPTAGISGNVLLVGRLKALGVPPGHALAALLLSVSGYYLAYALLALTVLALLWLQHAVTPILSGALTLFVLLASVLFWLALSLARNGGSLRAPVLLQIGLVRRFVALAREAPAALTRQSRLLVGTAVLNGSVCLADSATLLATLHAVGEPAAFQTAFIAFMMASIVTIMGPIPLGLGSFEATGIAMLTLQGISLEPAVAGILLLRGLTLWLPLIPGFLLTRRLLRRPQRPVSSDESQRARPPRPERARCRRPGHKHGGRPRATDPSRKRRRRPSRRAPASSGAADAGEDGAGRAHSLPGRGRRPATPCARDRSAPGRSAHLR